jgi:hypothetical protein
LAARKYAFVCLAAIHAAVMLFRQRLGTLSADGRAAELLMATRAHQQRRRHRHVAADWPDSRINPEQDCRFGFDLR